ncbi:SDR family oxidoreductase [Rhodobacteraceae bacterium D3-12]|nr:SDR family oxidoreductase [Rhodobacteraceae bacterium D3-12]
MAQKKVALVTGGARGIGRAIVEALSEDHLVVVHYNSTVPEGLGGGCIAVQADLRSEGAAEALIGEAIDKAGRPDVIVNNAGLVESTPKEAFDAQSWRAIFEVNLFAAGAILSAALPHLERGAAVVNISSVNAVLPPMGAAAYGASKAALDLWTRAMAKELGPQGIRVNAVAPGAINTPEAPRDADLTQAFVEMTALGRIGRPDDIAKAVRFLASDAAGFITGEVLTVSGGYRL